MWYVGSATLANNTSQQQTHYTPSFSKAIASTMSATVTTGVTSTSKLCDVVSVSAEHSIAISYSTATTQTSTVTDTYTGPDRPVVIPANTTAHVIATMQSQNVTGNLRLSCRPGIYPERHSKGCPVPGEPFTRYSSATRRIRCDPHGPRRRSPPGSREQGAGSGAGAQELSHPRRQGLRSGERRRRLPRSPS
ncbi:ETX/MTX2 family pore-forming toxin [Streptomyces sp. NPDC006879]|uniref:ETX/MTX2 family pore-forming toxin n=1 Tax=Streptomyces sp. NPDC006879 TaxID=3364767 RepID=UPI0036C4E7DC